MAAKSGPKRKGGVRHRRGMPWKPLAAVLVVCVLVGTLLYVRGRGDDRPSAADLQSTQRYCELATELDDLLVEAGVPSDGAMPAEVRPEAIKQVLTQFGARTEELTARAPSKIRDDVKTVVERLRQAGEGNPTPGRASGFAGARSRIVSYRQQLRDDPTSGCQEGAGSGEG